MITRIFSIHYRMNLSLLEVVKLCNSNSIATLLLLITTITSLKILMNNCSADVVSGVLSTFLVRNISFLLFLKPLNN